MARQGAAFKEIADILGHRSLVSTGVYAKLDLGSLSKVAMADYGKGFKGMVL